MNSGQAALTDLQKIVDPLAGHIDFRDSDGLQKVCAAGRALQDCKVTQDVMDDVWMVACSLWVFCRHTPEF